MRTLWRCQFADEVGPADATQALFDVTPFFGLIPEEILTLSQLVFLCLGADDRLKGIRVIACVPCFRGYGHRCRRKVLYLFQLEVEPLGDNGKFCHISLCAARMTADEVGDDLLVEVLFAIDTIEDAFEFVELLERRLAHQR